MILLYLKFEKAESFLDQTPFAYVVAMWDTCADKDKRVVRVPLEQRVRNCIKNVQVTQAV